MSGFIFHFINQLLMVYPKIQFLIDAVVLFFRLLYFFSFFFLLYSFGGIVLCRFAAQINIKYIPLTHIKNLHTEQCNFLSHIVCVCLCACLMEYTCNKHCIICLWALVVTPSFLYLAISIVPSSICVVLIDHRIFPFRRWKFGFTFFP